MSTAVTPEAILKELSELWVSLGKSDEAGVLRACAMTLIVAADEEEEAAVLGEMIAETMHEHPSRAIVLRIRDGNDPGLESRVFAQCWMPFGRRQQICCETIEIKASEGSLQDVPRIVHAVMAPDLPVVLVCRSPHLFASWAFSPLLRVAEKVIVDSRRCHTPASMLQHISNLRSTGHRIHDLAWTALTQWRESIASVFDDREALALLHRIQHISITHSGSGPSPEAWYLGAWLARGAGLQSGLDFYHGEGQDPIQRVEIQGAGLALSFSAGPGSVIHVVYNGVAKSVSFSAPTDWDLLREELSLLGRDAIYEDVLPKAIALSGGEDS